MLGVRPSSKDGWTPLLLIICMTVTFGTTVPVGYFFGVVNAPAELIKEWCNDILINEYDTSVSSSQLDIIWTSIVSLYLIGGICGSCISAWCSDKYGRKGCLVISSLLLIVSGILFTWCRAAKSLEMLMSGRFLGGLASALIFTAQPMYLLELAPSRLSGSVGVFTCIGVTGGILLGQVMTLPQILGNAIFWQYALSSYSLLVMMSLVPMWLWFPESPRWLYLIKRDAAEGTKALRRLRPKQNEDQMQQELLEMEQTLQSNKEITTFWKVLADSKLFLPLLLVCSFQASQQLSGINAIFFYSLSIFTDAGFSHSTATWLNLGLGGFNLCTSLLGPLLVHRIARRPLLMSSCLICGLSLIGVSFGLYFLDRTESTGLAYWCIGFILSFIFGFQLGLGPIAYFIGSELFEDSPRPVAMSLGSLFSWIGNFLVGMCFPLLQSVWSSFAFMPCMCVCIYCLILTWTYLPETRGRKPKDVQPLINQGLRSRPKQAEATAL